MNDYELSTLINENYKHIEDIIDARKQLGQYNVHKQTHTVNYRYAYSSSSGTPERYVRFDDTMPLNDGNNYIKRTDSEVTVFRMRCAGSNLKRRKSKWDMQDIAIPGDGSHLGESPSLVNLATLVPQNVPCEGDEYLVPLSSWDPYYKNEDQHPNISCCSESVTIKNKCPYRSLEPASRVITENSSHTSRTTTNSELDEKNSIGIEISQIFKRPSLAGRISKFIRKHCKKSKTLPESQDNSQSNRQ